MSAAFRPRLPENAVVTGSGEAIALRLFGPPETDEQRTWARILEVRSAMEKKHALREAFPSQTENARHFIEMDKMRIRSDLDRLRRIQRERVA